MTWPQRPLIFGTCNEYLRFYTNVDVPLLRIFFASITHIFMLHSHMFISQGIIYTHVIYAYFMGLYIFSCYLSMFYLSLYRYDVYFTCDMYFVFYYVFARNSTTFVVLRHSCTFLHCIYLHQWSYTSLRLMLFVVKTTWNIPFHSILFYSDTQDTNILKNWD